MERDRCVLLFHLTSLLSPFRICGLPLDQVDIEGRILHLKRLRFGLGKDSVAGERESGTKDGTH